MADQFPISGYRVRNKRTPSALLCIYCLKNDKLHCKQKGNSFLFAFKKHILVVELLLCLIIKMISNVQLLSCCSFCKCSNNNENICQNNNNAI